MKHLLYAAECTCPFLVITGLARAVSVGVDDAHSAGAGVSHQDGAVVEAGDAIDGCGEQRLRGVSVLIPHVCAPACQGLHLTCP